MFVFQESVETSRKMMVGVADYEEPPPKLDEYQTAPSLPNP